ncbi:hypothetical protein BDZ97DRAFT_221650 [Flammula alnicola]|nr:hypothetical protein BDZ97DRAFT_221650 [Flammula alnicola]
MARNSDAHMPLSQSSHALPSTRPLCQPQRSSDSSIHTTHNHHAMLAIASPVPLKAAFPPPFMRSSSPSPPSSASMSPDYYDSPPSPPRSLEDQVHVAYALDDIHLAKILLLRLKGIEVTSDDDPRIAAVQDEDFDFCFVPNGRLMDERDEKAMLEMQAREMALIEERRRVERLRNCQRKWEDEKRRMREERLAVLRRREKKRQEEEERRRWAEEDERRRVAEQERRRAVREKAAAAEVQRAAQRSRSRKVVSYQHHSSQHTFDDACAVPFTDVLKSMQGPLFPQERPRRTISPDLSKSRSRTHSLPKQRREARLLDALLADIEYTDEERRKRKGKQRAYPRRTFTPCLACNTTSPPASPLSTSSSSSSIPRTSSWLSFRGTASSSSASSSTTDLTTPSSSPNTFSKSSWFTTSRPKSWIPDSTPPPLRHSCLQHTRLASVPLSDSPLYTTDIPQPTKSAPISHPGRQRSTSTVRAAKEGAGVLVRRMSKLVELAKGLQNAYVSAALFSVSASYDGCFDTREAAVDMAAEDRNRNRNQGGKDKDDRESVLAVVAMSPSRRSAAASRPRAKLRPSGYRASALDIAKFLDPTTQQQQVVGSSASISAKASASPSAAAAAAAAPKYIPLTSPFPPTEKPRTLLPDPLPYKLIFKPVPSPSRSPFRFHALSELHTMYPSSAPSPAQQHHGRGAR